MIREKYFGHEGKGVVSVATDEAAFMVAVAHLGDRAIGRDSQDIGMPPPDNGEFASPSPNPGTGGGNSEITLAFH